MRRALQVAAIACAVFAVAACSIRLTDFTVISTKNVNVPNVKTAARTEGKHCAFFSAPNMKEAIDRAIESAGPEFDALTDGVLWLKQGLFKKCYVVQGTPISTKKKMGDLGTDAKVWQHSQRVAVN